MAYTLNMSGTAQVDDSLITAFDQSFIIAAGQAANLDGFATKRVNIGAKAISMPKYALISPVTTPLTEDEAAVATALSDTEVLLTPAEYGAVVTRTALASLQTGGKVDLAAAQLVGFNMGQSMDALFLAAVNGSSNTNAGALSATTANTLYTKLARKSIQTIGGAYVGVAHEDDLKLLRAESGWQDVQKYADPGMVLANEVGMFAGIRWVRNNLQTPGTVAAMGFNAVGKAVSLEPQLRITGPFDNLGRFVNIGWYGVFTYGLVDTDAVQILVD